MPLRRLSQQPPRPGQYVTVGSMNRQATFYLPGAQNTTTGNAGAPSAQFQCWLALFALSGEELDKAQQIAQQARFLAVINYQSGVSEGGTFEIFEGSATRVLQIAAIEDPDGQQRQLKIYCFEINQNAGMS